MSDSRFKLPSERMVTVCDECLRASCWHGTMLCAASRRAGTTEMPVSQLVKLDLEHPKNWSAKDAAEKAADDAAKRARAVGVSDDDIKALRSGR